MNGFASEKLIELQARAGDSKVAASAVRPPASTHRGRRSRNARCRRWDLWHAHVSQSLISLMPTVPFVVSKAGPDEQVASAFCGAASGCVSACASASAFALRAAPAPASVAAPAAAFALLTSLLPRILSRRLLLMFLPVVLPDSPDAQRHMYISKRNLGFFI